jgi:very-short-patch-repair endonuclease
MIIDKKHFTKSERRFVRRLQENHIPFKSKIKVNGREVDFICGKYAIDIDGHEQDGNKNVLLVGNGYIPIHIDNKSVSKINLSYLKK